MTDQPTNSAIDIIKRQVTALADPAATFQQIEHGIGDLWNAAEQRGDAQTIAYLQRVWDNTVALAQNNTAANNVAAAALQTAVEMAETAVKAQQELAALNDEIPDLVDAAYESGAEDAQQSIYETLINGYNGEVYFEDPGIEVINILAYEVQRMYKDGGAPKIACSEDDADDFVRYLGGHTPPMGDALALKVAAFIAEFGRDYRAAVKAAEDEAHRRREAHFAALDDRGSARAS